MSVAEAEVVLRDGLRS